MEPNEMYIINIKYMNFLQLHTNPMKCKLSILLIVININEFFHSKPQSIINCIQTSVNIQNFSSDHLMNASAKSHWHMQT